MVAPQVDFCLLLRRTKCGKKFLKAVYSQNITEDLLRSEWAKQVNEQTKPLKKQAKNIADKEIQENITSDKKTFEIYKGSS